MDLSVETLYPKQKMDEKKIWCCLLTNDEYLRGVLTLYHSLVKSGTKYPFYVMYTEVLAHTNQAECRH
jgi:hypothetical protein